MWNILIWGMRVSQNLDFLFGYFPIQTFCLLFQFPLLFSRSFYSCYLLRFIFFLGIPKSWVLTKDKAWKWDLDQLEL